MFGLKNDKPIAEPKLEVGTETIPADFYGGVNPVIKFKKVEKEVDLTPKKAPVITSAEKVLLDKATAAGGGALLHPANLFSSRKGLLILGGGLFVIFIAGSGIYYWLSSRTTLPGPLPQPPVLSTPAPEPEPEPTPPPVAIETPTTTPVAPPTSLAEIPLEFPIVLLADSADSDTDDLTNLAEELWRTDPAGPDSDEDGYNDGHEVFNLFNPTGKEPMKLVESGLVEDYTNPVMGYKVYYPRGWAVGNVDADYRDVLFSTITGENIEIRVFDRVPGESFPDWFARLAPGEGLNDLLDFESVFKDKGQRRRDYLVFYFYNDQNVFAIAYHTTDSATINYRSVIKMMARSFRLPLNNNVVIPLQIIEGERPASVPSDRDSGAATPTDVPEILPATTTTTTTPL